MGYVGTTPLSGDYRKLDDISSGFDGSDTAFTLQVGSANVTPPKETTLLISVGGILQEPITAYTVSGSTLTFTAAPATGADFFGVMLGDAMSIGTPANDTVTGDKIVDNAIDSEHYTDGSIDNAHIADDAIDSEHYAAASIDFAHIQNVAANSVLGRNANSSGVLSEVALATTQILIGDGTGFTAAALSGDATMTNAGVVSLAAAQTDITSLGTQAADFKVGNGYGVVIGDATQETVSIGDGATDLVPELQVLGTAAADSSMLLAAFSTTATTAGSPILAFAKGGNGTLGSHTVVTDGEELGNIIAFGDDGSDLETPAASIQFEVDGTPGSADMPGRIVFNTTADGATAVTEALRIDSSQTATFVNAVGIGNTPAHTTAGYELFLGDTSVAQSYMQFINSGTGTANSDGLIIGADASYAYFVQRENLPMAFYTNNTEYLRITAGGDIGIALSKKLAFDIAVGDTYIYQESADDLHIVVGGEIMLQIDQDLGTFTVGNNATPAAGQMMRVGHDFGELAGTSMYGQIVSTTIYDATNTNTTNTATGIYAEPNIKSNNTANWTGSAAVRGVQSEPTIEGSGTVTGVIGFYAGNPYKGGSATITEVYGLFMEDLTSGTTNYGIYQSGGSVKNIFKGYVQVGDGDVDTHNSYSALVIEKGDHSRLEFLNPTDKVATIWFSDTTEGMGRIEYRHSSDVMEFCTGGSTKALVLDSNQGVYIGDETNANMTVGLTINQGANDDQIFALKSSDIAHGMTSVSGPSETDDYLIVRKNHATIGGVDFRVYAEDAALNTPLNFQSYGGTATTTKSTSGIGLINFQAYEHDGSNGLANITSDGNVFSIRARVGGSLVTRMLVDEDGDLYSVTSAQTFDDYDDMAILDTLDGVRSGTLKGSIKAEFGKVMSMNERTMIDMGILGDTIANGGMLNNTQLARVHTGAIRQQNQKHMSLVDEVESLRGRLASAEQQLQALEAH